ncbi:MAG: lactate racemase domain-containing protein [Actinomycetota bacterium]|nr:lactate racemase domain-containing protein [Actinomycetota bacterium]
MKSIKLPQGGIFDKKDIKLDFPKNWDVEVCDSPANKMKAITSKKMSDLINSPVGSRTIREAARDKSKVVLIIEDISRGTRIDKVIKFILKELISTGIREDEIEIICAVGAHGAHDRIDFVKKLGKEVVEKFPVYNHNPFFNCKYIGKTSRGTRVLINPEVLECDLKISVGTIVPHPLFGFSGGGKIILPGISSIETIYSNHILESDSLKGIKGNFVDGLGRIENNVMQREMEEVCEMVGIDFLVNALVDYNGEIVDLVAGHPIYAHKEGVKKAKEIYGTSYKSKADLVIANANFKINEANIALAFGKKSLKNNGDIVIINHSRIGQVTHYLCSGFGYNYGGKFWSKDKGNTTKNINKVILFNPYINKIDEDWFGGFGKVKWASEWQEVINLLDYDSDNNVSVNLFTDATIQYFLN